MEYILHLFILAGIYTLLAQSLNLSAGYGKMISLSHAGFYGVGAYTAALFATNSNLPFLVILAIAISLCGFWAIILSSIALRTIDDYFIVCTLGIQSVIFSLTNNWMSLTRGPLGIAGIPSIQIFGVEIRDRIFFLLLTVLLVGIVFTFLNYLTKSSYGRSLISLSEDEIFTQSLGKNVYFSKMTAFTIGAMIAAIPGVLYAHYISFIDPSSFTLDESILILSIVIIGGMKNLWGSLIVSILIILLPEGLRFLGMSSAIAANMRQILYGLIIILIMYRYCDGFNSKKKLKSFNFLKFVKLWRING